MAFLNVILLQDPSSSENNLILFSVAGVVPVAIEDSTDTRRLLQIRTSEGFIFACLVNSLCILQVIIY
jgi:hypothetical protein